uniref:Centromere-associated protein E n=1 Tax=Serinus canaria TaxID=9135 RepID=A0A8C9UG71_SERCA
MADEGAVTVCVRVRPLIDRVFHSSDNTQQLYDGVAVPIIQSAVRGYNGTIFAYGQTASGKTYTMMGNEDSVGIIPKAIQHVFKIICEIPDREFLLRVSYMEIYNETITDLLCDNRKKKPLGIREDVNRNTYVEDLIEEVVVSPEQVMECIRKGEKNRHYGETKMNEHSSRSHTIFRMIIESRERSDPANANCDGAVMVSHLNLVDLAGSERASQTGSEGVRLKEGCNINRSLFILGQVIKKLCDDPSGFINYRDSKLTRILQNSLGGNAKTVIICTITPVSFDETLSTLQFANTAKGMKNTPKVNEVLDDDALLKRYRKEILDLKKQLEEVSSKTQIHAMEKDQLAQLLEEKNSLQKVQEDRIRNLTEMLVTSASFASKENVKAKRIKRRLTWAAGKINQENVSFFEDFENPMLTETKKMKLSLPAVPDVEDCKSVLNFLAIRLILQQQFLKFLVPLLQNIAVNEVNVLQTNFDNLVLENEQLKSEINELKERLKEKMEIDEFEALEKQTQKDHEIQLMHEITNLKNLVSNAEVYNEELEAEINSKLEQLKEKENKIKILQNRVEELQKAEVEKRETSFALVNLKIHQLNKSLLDSEAIALDAKKESAFLRSENLELKEKMKELLNNHNQMQKDVQLYQSQIEAGKASYRKMQADLQRELQSLFQENTRLTSLMEGKVPKDLLSHVELEKKAADLKGELEKALKDNALLQKQVNELSEFQLLPNTVEMQKKEILEKCEELHLLKLENEKLLSEVADNERRLKHMSEEIEKSKDNLTDVQLKFTKSDEEYVALKQLHEETEQKYIAASETNEQMKLQIECLSREAQESKTILDEVKLEVSVKNIHMMELCITMKVSVLFLCKLKLSSKMKELEEKEAEQKQLLELRENLVQTQQKLNELEQLKEEERISEVRLETKDLEIQAALQQLTECQEEIKTLTQERDNLKQKEEFLQAETEQLREDIKDTVSMESQKTVKKLEKSISEKEIQIMSVEEALGKTIKELQIQVKLYAIIKTSPVNLFLVSSTEGDGDDFKMQLEDLQKERDQLREMLQETISKNSEMQEELRCTRESLGQHQEKIVELEGSVSEKENELSKAQEALKEKADELQQKVRSSFVKKITSSAGFGGPCLLQTSVCRIQQLTETLNSVSCEKDQLLAERTSYSLQVKEQISSLNHEKDELQKLLQDVRSERDQLKTELQRTSEVVSVAICLPELFVTSHLRCYLHMWFYFSVLKQRQNWKIILKDVSEMENELVCIEADLKQEESARKETIQFWEACSGTHWDAEELKEELNKDNERLLQVFKFWTPKVKVKLNVIESEMYFAKLDKGAELYKEEIDHLKTQLVKSDLERMKQSNSFEQSQTPLTCGGGSGIVQSTQILVLKSEQAKLQKENLQLKKQNDLLLSDELELKEELRKWKERALKWRERSSRETTRETTPKSPKKAVSYFFKEQMPSPCKETVSQEKVTQDLPKPLPLTCPTNFFDNSNLGVLTGPECKESTEEHLRHLFGTSDRDKAPDCSTQ